MCFLSPLISVISDDDAALVHERYVHQLQDMHYTSHGRRKEKRREDASLSSLSLSHAH